MRLSKNARDRLKMATASDRKKVKASARTLHEYSLISGKRALAIKRATDR